MHIQTVLSQIDLGSYALPVFQRGYVWSREQVRNLMTSLYKEYPIGGLLVWVTQTDKNIIRGEHEQVPSTINLILDGQQRITTLYGIMKGKEPPFFEGDKRSFTGLYFDLDEEVFEFYRPNKMKDKLNWINVTELMQMGVGNFITSKISENPENSFLMQHLDKLTRIDNIKNRDMPIQEVTGPNMTIDVVVEIFNNVNSGGTKLSSGDLILAKICAEWPEARGKLQNILRRYSSVGYSFNMDWLLRCLTVYLTGQPYYTPLENVPVVEIQSALPLMADMIGDILDVIASRLGLDNHKMLGSRFSIPVIIGVLRKNGGHLPSQDEWDKLLYWYVHTFLWGRYAGSTESTMSQDLNIIAEGEGADGLIRQFRQNRGVLRLNADDFRGWGSGTRLYPLLYMLTRVYHARDFATGVELRNQLLGHNSTLEIHHIFPKNLLYRAGYKKSQVNALANYAFLTKQTNLAISNKQPKDYLPQYIQATPGAIESNWIPTNDDTLFEISEYERFLEKRRELLADAANHFLDSLLNGEVAPNVAISTGQQALVPLSGNPILDRFQQHLIQNNLPVGETDFEVLDEKGNPLAVFDIAWPNGIQEGFSEPVALVLEDDEDAQMVANQHSFRYFVDTDELTAYIYETMGISEEEKGVSQSQK